MLRSFLIVALFVLSSSVFAISPGAGQAQTNNSMQEMQRNQQRMKQVQQRQANIKQNVHQRNTRQQVQDNVVEQ